MEIFKKEIDGKLHIRIEYTEEEKAEMEGVNYDIRSSLNRRQMKSYSRTNIH